MRNKTYIKEIREKIINITSVKPSKVSELSQQLNININTLRVGYLYKMLHEGLLKREKSKYSPLNLIDNNFE
tara:strand:+ start:4063 stop:4278 length:216 start_codon:yes stop_codon:yes gene_type:complete